MKFWAFKAQFCKSSIASVKPSILFIIRHLILDAISTPLVTILWYILSWIWNVWILFVGTLLGNLRKIQNNSSWGCGRFLKKMTVIVPLMVTMPHFTVESWANTICYGPEHSDGAVCCFVLTSAFRARTTVCSCMHLLFNRKAGETSKLFASTYYQVSSLVCKILVNWWW